MRRRLCLLLALCGCGQLGSATITSTEDDGGGEVSLAITVTPPGARCAQLTIKKDTTTTYKQVSVSAGSPATFSFKGLPTGTVKLSEQVFTKTCASGLTSPEWASDEVTVELKSGVSVEVTLVLRETNTGGVVTVHTSLPDPPVFEEITVSEKPLSIVAGPDGNVWVGMGSFQESAVARITPSGVVTEHPTDLPAESLTVGPDGNFWYFSQGALIRISPGGAVSTVSVPIQTDSQGARIAAGPDGNLWLSFVDNGTAALTLARLSLSGQILGLFPVPPPTGPGVGALTAGPDGNVWFTVPGAAKVGRITPAGVITLFALPNQTVLPDSIVTGPDGNLWIAESPRIARLSPSGTLTEFMVSLTSGSSLGPLTSGADGNLWFVISDVDPRRQALGRITTAGSVKLFPRLFNGRLTDLASGPDGFLWMGVSSSAFQVVRVDPTKF